MFIKILKIAGIIILIIVILIISLLIYISTLKSTPDNYTETTKTGGDIESEYLKTGPYSIEYVKHKGEEQIGDYHIYYPATLKESNDKYPVVIILNGTGVLPKKYDALFKHLASWGFAVIGNDDPSTGFGISADLTFDHLIEINSDQESLFYGKLDLDKVGITGHSQGGAGVLSALSITEHAKDYLTGVSLSPTHEEMAHAFGWNYDLSKIEAPLLMIAGTKGDFETKSVIPLKMMKAMYDKIPSFKVMMRKIDMEHGQMLYSADGYVTAWFCWQLKGDEKAAEAFRVDGEIMSNPLYQDQRIDNCN